MPGRGRLRPLTERWWRFLHVPVAVSVLAWRVVVLPPGRLWFDWAAVISAYWIVSLKGRGSKHWPTVTASVVGLLLAIHILGQIRQSLTVLGLP
jgi:hypothetical protein